MMKKLLCAMLTLMLFALSCVPALAEAPAPSVGGWSVNTGDPADIPQEVLDAFSKAVEGLKKRLEVDLASQVAPAIGERIRLRIAHGNLFAAA